MNGMIPKIWLNFRCNDVALGHLFFFFLWKFGSLFVIYSVVSNIEILSDLLSFFCASHSFIIPFYQINGPKKKLVENIFAQITNE